MVVKVWIRFLFALAHILSLTAVMPATAEDGPSRINPMVQAIFTASGKRQVVKERRSKTGGYRVTETLFPAGSSPGTYNLRWILRVKHSGELVGWGKSVCTISIVD